MLAYSAIADQPRAWILAEWVDSADYGDYTRYMNELGMQGGVTAPLTNRIGEFGAISAVSHIPEAISGENANAVWIIGQCAALRAETIGVASASVQGQLHGLALLKDHQLEVLEWIAKVKSNADIALITARSRVSRGGDLKKTSRFHQGSGSGPLFHARPKLSRCNACRPTEPCWQLAHCGDVELRCAPATFDTSHPPVTYSLG